MGIDIKKVISLSYQIVEEADEIIEVREGYKVKVKMVCDPDDAISGDDIVLKFEFSTEYGGKGEFNASVKCISDAVLPDDSDTIIFTDNDKNEFEIQLRLNRVRRIDLDWLWR